MCQISKKIVPNQTRILLGRNIVYYRQKNQLSQEELAEKMNADKGYISQIENAKRNASTDYINRFCEVFHIEPIELFLERKFSPKKRIDSRK